MPIIQNRRRVLAGLSAMAAGLMAPSAGAEPPPEVTRVRLPATPKVTDCVTPIYISEELLRAEGFTDIQFVTEGTDPDWWRWLPDGDLDFDNDFAPEWVRRIDKGIPVKVLSGMHSGCLELIAGSGIGSVKELKGKRIGINAVNSSPHVLVKLMVANVGLDPETDFEWVTDPAPLELFAQGRIDAFLASPPEPQQARARNLGHVILETTLDRPWSQYFCCMFAGNVDFVRNYPIATKRVLRAVLKAVDLCVSNPQMAARRSAETGIGSSYENVVNALTAARFDRWRDYDPVDTLRFYSLRLQELGFINKTPNDIITQGTDWRFLNELKRELKT